MNEQKKNKIIAQNRIDWNNHAEYWNDFLDAREYNNRVIKSLQETIKLKNLNILDFGCGTGLLTEHMMKEAQQIVAVDLADKMIEILAAKKLKNVIAIQGELNQNTIQMNKALQQKFDLIVAASVCAFVPNFQEILSNIKSLLKPNGLFIQWDWLLAPEVSDFGFSEEMIRENYRAVGLNIESISIPFFFQEYEEKMEVIMAVGKL